MLARAKVSVCGLRPGEIGEIPDDLYDDLLAKHYIEDVRSLSSRRPDDEP